MTATALILSMMLLSPNPGGTTSGDTMTDISSVPPMVVAPTQQPATMPQTSQPMTPTTSTMRETTPAAGVAPTAMPKATPVPAHNAGQYARGDEKAWEDFDDFPSRPAEPKRETPAVRKMPQIIPPPADNKRAPAGKVAEKTDESVNMIAAPTPSTPETAARNDPIRLPTAGPRVVANHVADENTKTRASSLQQTMRINVDSSLNIELDKPVDAAGITDPEIADLIVLTPTKLMLVGKGPGTTQLRLRTGDNVTVHHIHVEPNTEVLQDLIRTVSPSADVRVNSVKGQIVLSGRVSDVMDVQRIADLAKAYQGGEVINHLNVAGVQQTLLRVVVAEVNKDAARKLGVNWGFGGSDISRDVFFANNLNQLNPTSFGSSGLNNVLNGQLTYNLAPNAVSPNANFTIGFPKAELQFFLNALRENSLGRTLAEPNLVAISGQTATFLAGGEVPIPVTQGGATAGAITLEYKEFGVRLAFTPTVIGGQLIRLHVMSEVSDAVPQAQQFNGLPVFSFQTRRVESTVECGNGQTFAMAGLLDDSIRAVSSKIPGLGDLPVLGTLFSSVDYQRSKTELVVLVTPELVAPLDPGQIKTYPGADITEPDDFELFMLQKLKGGPEKDAPPPSDIAPDAYVSDPRDSAITAGEFGLEGPWGMTGD